MPEDSTIKRSSFGATPEEFVAIDLETTGLNRASDRITEVGATRFNRLEIIDTFQSLVNPGRPIPQQIQQLTGISDRIVAGAPTIDEVGVDLISYIGNRPVVGQNVPFDLDFLEAAGVKFSGLVYDTLDIASVLLPTARRLDLGSLVELLSLQQSDRHRALSDAEATRDVFLKLLELLDRLPQSTLMELRSIAESANWSLSNLVQDALELENSDHSKEPIPARNATDSDLTSPPLIPREPPLPVTSEDVTRMFELAARRPEILVDFEPRPGQLSMSQAVAANIASSGHLIVEAGTGIGKSLAYLLPMFLHAVRNQGRVVISTHTLNLQEQLDQRDIKMAAAIVEEDQDLAPGTVRSVVLKGAANYLCLERWADAQQSQGPRTFIEARLHARIAVWLSNTTNGDMAELYMPSEQLPAWRTLAADSNDCLARKCPYVGDGSCFLLRARKRASTAHSIVVNHALLLSSTGQNQVLPRFGHLLIDEGHHLEEVATQQFGSNLSLSELVTVLDDLRGPSGEIEALRKSATARTSPISSGSGIVEATGSLSNATSQVRQHTIALIESLQAYASERQADDDVDQGRRNGDITLTTARHSQPFWAIVEEAAIQVDITLLNLVEQLIRVRAATSILADENTPDIGPLQSRLAYTEEVLGTARSTLQDSILSDDPDQIVWLSIIQQDVRLNVAPLEISEHLADDLYAECESVTVTSATLTATGSFEFSIRSLGLQDPDTLQVPSPFDYKQSVLVLAVEDLPEPNHSSYSDEAHRTLISAVSAASGRTLALFTSRSAVRAAAVAVRDPLGSRDINVLAQGLDGPPTRILRTLIEEPRTLVLGTSALWEGIDVRGDSLSQIVVARLPFPVPTNPIYAGRAAAYDNPFTEYAVPQAVLRFRQGFGRLIRSAKERGVFLILDSRVVQRRYGDTFLDALPDCELRRIPASAVSDAITSWLTE